MACVLLMGETEQRVCCASEWLVATAYGTSM